MTAALLAACGSVDVPAVSIVHRHATTTSSSTSTTSTSTTLPPAPTTTAAPAPTPVDPPPETDPPMRATNGGAHSDAFWWGVAVCEQGGLNDPYFGYLSFMDGSEGGKPWAEQVAAANALGEGAWAPACVAAGYAASPAG